MRRYGVCFLLAAAIILACFLAGYAVSRNRPQYETIEPIPNTVYETEPVTEGRIVIWQETAEPVPETAGKERFLLVSETGYLMVFSRDDSQENMQTHIPLSDFPQEEQEKLREGIWFESMMEVFCYLESFTS